MIDLPLGAGAVREKIAEYGFAIYGFQEIIIAPM
jgi:hypothetical protein